jgi:cystathionine beta-lyase/cystathionine gamma-synthase
MTEFATHAIHGGRPAEQGNRPVNPSIVTSVNFAAGFGEIGFSADATVSEGAPFAYAREGHPTGRILERRMALLEKGADAVAFASGMGAISGLLLHLLGPGDHVVVTDVSYAGTAEFARGLLRRLNVEVSTADASNLAEVRAAMRPSTKVVYVETPCNPHMALADIAALAEIAHAAGAQLVVDSTFASPAVTQPLALGADFVVHSLTKYCAGHGDAIGGIVVGRDAAVVDGLRREIGTHLGAMLSPFNAWLIMRGLETLSVRMPAYAAAATRVAEFLERHPFVTAVRYPGLRSHPQYALAQRQMATPSGMIAFTVRDPMKLGRVLDRTLKVITYAASLGETCTLLLYCDTADLQRTTFRLDPARLATYRQFAGDGLFRLSVGLEDPADICDDLNAAFDAAAAS